MAKAVLNDLAALCEALGVDDPNTVTRVVVDTRAGHDPMLYVERIGDARKILAALSEPGIELRREEPAREGAPAPRPHQGRSAAPVVHGNVSGAQMAWNNGNVTQNGR